MAQLLPDLSVPQMHSSGYWREIDVLTTLQQTMPEGYEIFHSVDWHSLYQGQEHHGEIDLVVMNQAGALLLVEVKAGEVCVRDGGFYKVYGQRTRQIDVQLKVQYGAMRGLLAKARIETPVVNCLVLPDFKIGQAEIVAIPRARIFDADDYDDLAYHLQQLLPQDAPGHMADQVRAFLTNHLGVAQDVSVLRGQLTSTVRKLAEGLATWVPRMHAPSNLYRIEATAGSGKTQLALTLLKDAAEHGQRALYVCFNRPLADHIARLATSRVEVSTFHALCIDHYARSHPDLNFTDPGVFQAASTVYIQASSQIDPTLDLLVIDEAQDFEPGWVEALINHLKPEGRLYVMEDADQCLYPRTAFDLPDAVTVACHDNFRCPRQVCATINALGLASHPIQARSPFTGDIPALFQYDGSEKALLKQTETAVKDLIAQGIPVSEIVVLSMRGLKHSTLLPRDQLAGFSTRRFTGDYSVQGTPRWTEGELLLESVYRFKGQSATAVVLTEIDFTEYTYSERARLFVGMTRALISVSLVLSSLAASLLDAEIEA
jgi:hypothetical protein